MEGIGKVWGGGRGSNIHLFSRGLFGTTRSLSPLAMNKDISILDL